MKNNKYDNMYNNKNTKNQNYFSIYKQVQAELRNNQNDQYFEKKMKLSKSQIVGNLYLNNSNNNFYCNENNITINQINDNNLKQCEKKNMPNKIKHNPINLTSKILRHKRGGQFVLRPITSLPKNKFNNMVKKSDKFNESAKVIQKWFRKIKEKIKNRKYKKNVVDIFSKKEKNIYDLWEKQNKYDKTNLINIINRNNKIIKIISVKIIPNKKYKNIITNYESFSIFDKNKKIFNYRSLFGNKFQFQILKTKYYNNLEMQFFYFAIFPHQKILKHIIKNENSFFSKNSSITNKKRSLNKIIYIQKHIKNFVHKRKYHNSNNISESYPINNQKETESKKSENKDNKFSYEVLSRVDSLATINKMTIKKNGTFIYDKLIPDLEENIKESESTKNELHCNKNDSIDNNSSSSLYIENMFITIEGQEKFSEKGNVTKTINKDYKNYFFDKINYKNIDRTLMTIRHLQSKIILFIYKKSLADEKSMSSNEESPKDLLINLLEKQNEKLFRELEEEVDDYSNKKYRYKYLENNTKKYLPLKLIKIISHHIYLLFTNIFKE